MTKEDAARDIINRFQEQYGVSKEALEKYIGRKAEAFTVQSINRLRGVYTALKDGTASVEQYFDMTDNEPEKAETEPGNTLPETQEEQVSLKDLLD